MNHSRMAAARHSPKNKRAPSARQLACEILSAAEKNGPYLDQILEQRLGRAPLFDADRALVTALVHGVMRMRGRLDFEIAQYFRKNYASAPALLKNILRVALFQMRFMNRIPAYAAINEAVALARAKFGENLARLSNAVLRNAERSPYIWPPVNTMLAQHNLVDLSSYLSYPGWLLERWQEEYGGQATLALAQAFNEIPDIHLRIVRPAQNTETVLRELEHMGISHTPIPDMPTVYKLSHFDQIAALQVFQNGLCTVQDASTCLPAMLAAPQAGESILDLCAAPGGKALHLAELASPDRVLAVDVSAKRLHLLAAAARRMQMTIPMVASDARDFSAPPVEVVLVDAPCSGLGVMGRRSDLRWRRRPEEIAQLVQLQKEILTNAARLVKDNGRLIYCTCTIAPEENEEIAAWFLQHHAQFVLQPAQNYLPAQFCDAQGFVHTWPHRHQMDGSFAVRFLKTS